MNISKLYINTCIPLYIPIPYCDATNTQDKYQNNKRKKKVYISYTFCILISCFDADTY